MSSLVRGIIIQAGSFEPIYWLFTNPATGMLVDLTAGYSVSGKVSTQPYGNGTTLLMLADADFRRTADGRVYYEPHSATSAAWTFRVGHYQFKLRHPVGEDIRFSGGLFAVSPEV